MWNQFSASSARKILFVTAASVGAVGFIAQAGAADPGATDSQTTAQASQPPRLPDGFIQKDESAEAGVRKTLAQLTQRAVTKDSYNSFFSSFLSDLASRDKARAKEFKGVDQNHLNDLIGQIQANWHTKYGQDFDASEANLSLDEHYPIAQGEVSDLTVATNNWPAYAMAGQAVTASSTAEQQQCNSKALSKGQAVAIIRLPAGDGLPDMNVSLLHQTLTGWHIDLPVTRTGEEIYNDLTAHLSAIATHQDLWPSNVTDAYRMVTRNVAAALYGVASNGRTASAQ